MKLKKIAIICLSVISINSFAYRIIDEQSSCNGFVNCGTVNKKITTNMKDKTNAFYVTAEAHPATGKVNTFIQLNGDHCINISNTNKENQLYEYIFDLICADANYHYVRHVELEPNESFILESKTTGVIQKNTIGSWNIYAKTEVKGEKNRDISAKSILTVNK